MNKRIIFCGWLCSWLFVCLLWAGSANSEQKSIHVELSYSGSASSYILYQDGVQVCTSTIPDAMECTVEFGAAPITFTLTAVDAEGVESPPSAPYTLYPPTPDPAHPGNYLPQATLTTSGTSGTAPLLVSFNASGSSDPGGTISRYIWNFGDGPEQEGLNLVDHLFDVPGEYTVTLTIEDNDGNRDDKNATITVSAPQEQSPSTPANQTPVAVITETPPAAGTSLMGFSGSASTDADGTIVSYAWNFGDGAAAVGVSIQHEFSNPGNYTVVLTVTDNSGATSQDQLQVTVVDAPEPPNVPPVAIISASSQQRLMHYTWEYAGTDPGLSGFRLYQNGRLACQIADPAAREADCLTYVDSGVVRLWVTSYENGVESDPSASLTFDSTGLFPVPGGDAPLAVHFTAGASADPDGTITAYAWNFGDGDGVDAATGGMEVDHVFMVPGNYTVSLTVTDNNGVETVATIVIPVTFAQTPIAGNASFTTEQDKSVTATLSASDPDGNPLTFRITKNGVLGKVTITNKATGVFTYVPNTGAVGTDTFRFRANDGTSDSNPGVVTITIQKKNSEPVAQNKTLIVQEDKLTSSYLKATDLDMDPLTFSLVTQPTHGTATLVNATTGFIRYLPQANFTGTDSFTFKVNDGNSDSGAATVTVTVAPVNDAPTATGVPLSTTEDTQALGTLAGTDLDGDPLTYSIITNGSLGNVLITDPATGAFTYTPNSNKNGQDTFVYRVNDGLLTADATVQVTITAVNDAPKANLDLVQVQKGGSIVIPVLANDIDVDGDPLTLVKVNTAPAYGTAVVVNGQIKYTANDTFVGIVSFTYRIKDGVGGATFGRVKVTVVN